MIDFSPVKSGSQPFSELAESFSKADLYNATDEMIHTMQSIIADAIDEDVVFIPQDPNAKDTFGIPEENDLAWTLGHVIVHVTASAEEAAALALSLARGLPVEGRSRYETPWRTVQSILEVRQRLEESRQMRKAMLDAWPREPHFDVLYTAFARYGPMNAVGRFLLGLSHDTDHLGQLREIMRQAREAHPRG